MADPGRTDELERRLEQVLASQASAASVPPDLATVARDGALRRRRQTVGAAVAAAAIIAAGIALPQSGLLSSSGEPPAAGTGDGWESLETWWTDGTALHYAGHEVPIRDQPLRAVVETAEGIVYTTDRGDAHALWKDGTTELIGERVQNLPMASLGSSLVAWTTRGEPTATIVRFDMADRTTETLEVEPRSFAMAVDEDTVYVAEDDQTFAWSDLADPEPVRLPGRGPGDLAVLEAQGDLVLITDDEGVALYQDGERADWFVAGIQFPFLALSADATHLAVSVTDQSSGVTANVEIWDLTGERKVPAEGLVGSVRDMRWDAAGTLVVTTEPEGEADDYEFTKTQAFACAADTGACTAVEGSDVNAYALPQISTDALWQLFMFIGS